MQITWNNCAEQMPPEEFEKLLGFKIHTRTIFLMHDTYEKYVSKIQAIQLSAAFKVKGEV